MQMIHLPELFIQRMHDQLGVEAPDFFTALDQPPPVSIRLHHSKGRCPFPLNMPVPWSKLGYYLEDRPSFHLDPHWHGGAYYVQEASSMILDAVLSTLVTDKQPRIWVDLCAAPGGKSGILASHLGPGDILLANEVVSGRRSVLRENLTKAGYMNTFISGYPSHVFDAPFADIMLIDAPCAGEGMMRKDPEAIRQWSPSLVQSCCGMQRQIVSEAIRALKEGGLLIYSTCSYSEEENLSNILHFTNTLPLQSIAVNFPEDWGLTTLEKQSVSGYQLFPHKVRGEGLFIAVLQKTAVESDNRGKSKKIISPFASADQMIGSIFKSSNHFQFRKNNVVFQFVTAEAEPKASELLMHLPAAEAIAEAGECKGKDVIPSHFVAMSDIPITHEGILDLDLDTALDYLQRSTNLSPALEAPGWYLIRYHQTILGWAKRTQQGWKNHYPMAWRLRNR